MIMKVRVLVKIGRKQGLMGWDGERLTVGVDAPPVEGAANTKLIAVLSEALGVSKSLVEIVHGHTARYKTLEIDITETAYKGVVEGLPRLPRQGELF